MIYYVTTLCMVPVERMIIAESLEDAKRAADSDAYKFSGKLLWEGASGISAEYEELKTFIRLPDVEDPVEITNGLLDQGEYFLDSADNYGDDYGNAVRTLCKKHDTESFEVFDEYVKVG